MHFQVVIGFSGICSLFSLQALPEYLKSSHVILYKISTHLSILGCWGCGALSYQWARCKKWSCMSYEWLFLIAYRLLAEQPILLSFPWQVWEIPALVLSFSLSQIIYYLCFPTVIKVRIILRIKIRSFSIFSNCLWEGVYPQSNWVSWPQIIFAGMYSSRPESFPFIN